MNKKAITLGIALALACAFYAYIQYQYNHQDKIFLNKADKCYKQKNIECTLDYLEKAFDIGVSDYKRRDLYVNLLLNSNSAEDLSPEIKTQERLVKFLDYPIDDSSKLRVEYYTNDLRQKIYKQYPENYIMNAVYNQKTMRWGNLPITYGFENTQNVPSYYIDEINTAFEDWQKSTHNQINFSKTSENPNIIIKFNPQNPAKNNDEKYVVAFTNPEISGDKLNHMVINFYLNNSTGELFSQNQVYNTALHEIMHAMGFMGHSNDVHNIMYPSNNSNSVARDERENLSQADINTLTLLYKIKPDITNTAAVESQYLPYFAMGSQQEIDSTKLHEAKSYVKKAPNITSGYIDLASNNFMAKNYAKAIKILEKALVVAKTEQEKEMIYYNLAIAYYSIDSTKLATDYLRNSMRIRDTEEKRYLLAEIYTKDGNLEKAADEYTNLIKHHPENIEYTIGLTNIYVIERKYLKARATLKYFLKNNPSQRNNERLEPYGVLLIFL